MPLNKTASKLIINFYNKITNGSEIWFDKSVDFLGKNGFIEASFKWGPIKI